MILLDEEKLTVGEFAKIVVHQCGENAVHEWAHSFVGNLDHEKITDQEMDDISERIAYHADRVKKFLGVI